MDRVVAKMIETPSPERMQSFYSALNVAGIGVGLDVRNVGEGKGKGIFAIETFEEGDPLLIEPPLVAIQDTANKVDALVCAHCFQYVGSIELQIGRKLSLTQRQASSRTAEYTPPSEAEVLDSDEEDESGALDDQVTGNGRGAEFAETTDSPNGLGTGLDANLVHHCEEDDSEDERIPAPPKTIAALLDGTLKLPLSEQFPLPAVVECLGGCPDNVYCSETCASVSWEAHHKLLCAGPRSEAADAEALRGFRDFADGSNNIFHVAAQVVAATVVRVRKGGGATIPEHLLGGSESAAREGGGAEVPVHPRGGPVSAAGLESASEPRGDPMEAHGIVEQLMVDENGLQSTSSGVQSETSTEPSQRSDTQTTNSIGSSNGFRNPPLGSSSEWDSLLKAWEPFSMGCNGVWWESVACPPEMGRPEEEAEFRGSIRELCDGSLQLLRAAFGREAETYRPLFSLEVYSRIIGMFELNNLALVVQSPVENYFLAIDELPEDEKRKVEPVTKPLLDALGRSYSAHCEGTAFYTLQSCANHSCAPNARAFKREQDVNGHAVLLANRRIEAGQEVTISYIDEIDDYIGRQRALADYGFVCRCSRCLTDSLSD